MPKSGAEVQHTLLLILYLIQVLLQNIVILAYTRVRDKFLAWHISAVCRFLA